MKFFLQYLINKFLLLRTFIPFIIILIITTLLPVQAFTQVVTEAWTKRFNSGMSTHAKAQKVILDENENSYVAGLSNQPESRSPVHIIKYSPSGEQLWETRLEIDLPGEPVIDLAHAGESVFLLMSVSGESYIARYDTANGSEIWVKRHEKVDNINVNLVALSTDKKGGVYVAGYSYSSSFINNDYLTARYNAANGEKLWEASYDFDFQTDQASAIVADDNGGIYVTGYSFGPGTTIRYATLKYDAATGKEIWESRYNGSSIGYSRASAIAVDNTGGVYVTGTIQLFEGFPSDWDYGTVRYDAITGEETWASHYHIDGYESHAIAIAVDISGGVYVTGWSNKINFEPKTSDFATVRYAAATGEQTWVKRYDGPGNLEDKASALGVDNNGGIYVTGWSQVSNESFDYFTLRYSALNGEEIWGIGFNGNENRTDLASDLAVSSSGNVFVTGSSINKENVFDFLTIKYSQDGGKVPCDMLVSPQLYLHPYAIKAGEQVRTTADFGDYILGADHGIRWKWGDGSEPSVAYTAHGTPRITGQHRYAEAGIYRVGLDFSESCLAVANENYGQWQVIYDPAAGSVTGGGQIISPVSSYAWMSIEQRVQYSINIRYTKANDTAPQGHTQLNLGKVGNFRANNIEWLVVKGDQAIWKGTGTMSGKGNYTFIASAYDAGGKGATDKVDKLRIRIWDKSRGNTVVYDNFDQGDIYNMSVSAPNIESGQIVIHNLKGNKKMVLAGKGNVLEVPGTSQLTAYPNTFSEQATIAFVLEQSLEYALEVYDDRGKLVRPIASGKAEAGMAYEHKLDAAGLPEGLYIVRIRTSSGTQSIKVLLKYR